MRTTNSGHDGAMHICITGHRRPTERTPYYGSVMAKLRPSGGYLPSYAWVQNLAGDVKPWYKTGGALGMAHAPLLVGRDLDNPSNPKFRFKEFDPPQDCTADRLNKRHELLGVLEHDGRTVPGDAAAAFGDLQQKAIELVTGNEAKRAFNLSFESDVRSTIVEDIYIILADFSEDESATIKVYLNPMVSWLWTGGWVIAFGTTQNFHAYSPAVRSASQNRMQTFALCDGSQQARLVIYNCQTPCSEKKNRMAFY